MSGKSVNQNDETLTDMFQPQSPVFSQLVKQFTLISPHASTRMQIDLGHRDPLTGIDMHSRNCLAGVQRGQQNKYM